MKLRKQSSIVKTNEGECITTIGPMRKPNKRPSKRFAILDVPSNYMLLRVVTASIQSVWTSIRLAKGQGFDFRFEHRISIIKWSASRTWILGKGPTSNIGIHSIMRENRQVWLWNLKWRRLPGGLNVEGSLKIIKDLVVGPYRLESIHTPAQVTTRRGPDTCTPCHLV